MKKLLMPLLLGLFIGSQVKAQSVVSPEGDASYAVNYPSGKDDLVTPEDQDDAGRSKTFSRTFPADASDKVSLNNQFGSIVVKIWDRKEVRADVSIVAYSNNAGDAQKLLEEVSVEASKSGGEISWLTKFAQRNNNWGSGSRNGRKWRREVKVRYVVFMPAANALNVSQQYGDVTLGDFSAPLYAKVQYGNLKATNLRNANNYISVQYGRTDVLELNSATIKHQYGSGLSLGNVGNLNLTAQYVRADIKAVKGEAVIRQQYGDGLTMGTVGQLTLDAQYTKVRVADVRRTANNIKIQYGSLDIGNITDLTLKAQYTGVVIGTLSGNALLNAQYNNLSVGRVGEGCKKLVVDAQYVNVSLNFADNYQGTLDVQTSYGGFNFENRVSARLSGGEDRDGSTTKSYTGKIGNGSTNYVKVKSAYGSVSFK
jgi:hypothetical protein